ncbi:MAG: class I SAM-dependent methyltransferase [Gammaproteobacteria bacterium]|nr:class I SAM-dependent methyltransferase [Gammaproteobacteria bacterium]
MPFFRNAKRERHVAQPGSSQPWFEELPGRAILSCELEEMASLLPDLFGYHLVFVGAHPYVSLVDSSRVQHASLIDTRSSGQAPVTSELPMVRASANDLPVGSDSVDVVVLPHVLEFEPRPHDALREAERVLVPEGHLLISGFNPLSMLGLWQLAKRRRGQPWSGKFMSMARLRDWLTLLGFDIVTVRHRFFRPPIGNERFLAKTSRMEAVGTRAWPYLSGTYVVLARKRVTTVTPIRTRWRPRRRLVAVGLAEPSARSADRARSVDDER